MPRHNFKRLGVTIWDWCSVCGTLRRSSDDRLGYVYTKPGTDFAYEVGSGFFGETRPDDDKCRA